MAQIILMVRKKRAPGIGVDDHGGIGRRIRRDPVIMVAHMMTAVIAPRFGICG